MIESLVSTIIPVHNRPAQLREAVDSALSQDYAAKEILIIDDGSTDETYAVGCEFEKAYPDTVKAVRQGKAGPGVAREAGRRLARGEFIQYLDSDDLLLPGKFRSQVAALRSQPWADVAYGITYLRDAEGVLIEKPHKKTGERLSAMFPDFLVERLWETATPLYRSTVTDRAGPWTSLSLEEDWEYDCRIASLGAQLAWVPHPVSEHRDHGGTRLSRGAAIDPARLRQRAQAHTLIYAHARAFGITNGSAHMKRFSRSLFLLSRQCGAAGLATESRQLFELSRLATEPERAKSMQFRIYAAGARTIGWTTMGKLSCWLDEHKAALS
jgi:hypothetical protein